MRGRTISRGPSASAHRIGVRKQTKALLDHLSGVVDGLVKEIARPQVPAGAAGIVLMMGFPGVGKSHCARLLAGRLGAAHVASDQLRSQLFIAPSYGRQENAALFRLLDALIERLLDEGHRVVVDATHLRATYRASTVALARRKAVPLTCVLVVADEAATRQRLRERGRVRAAHDKSEADEAVYEAMQARGFEEPDEPYLTLRNDVTLDAEIERIALELGARWAAAS
jgi:predicted kinase